uniref:Putative ovule protein n=1 Tax=Solanum chacoense TaxID=4108 RepID=A0A0V0GW32_SOLCH
MRLLFESKSSQTGLPGPQPVALNQASAISPHTNSDDCELVVTSLDPIPESSSWLSPSGGGCGGGDVGNCSLFIGCNSRLSEFCSGSEHS